MIIEDLYKKILDEKMKSNDKFIRLTFYELRVKNNLSEEETEGFLKLCISELEKQDYNVYVGNEQYNYKNAVCRVQSNELLIAFKNDV